MCCQTVSHGISANTSGCVGSACFFEIGEKRFNGHWMKVSFSVTIQLAWILLQDKARGAENRSIYLYVRL